MGKPYDKRLLNRVITKKKLEQLYCDQKMSMIDIAKELGYNRDIISRGLKDYDIKLRSRSQVASLQRYRYGTVVLISEEELQHRYWDLRLSTEDIANEFDCTPGTIVSKMKQCNIPLRPIEERFNSIAFKSKISQANTKYHISKHALVKKYCKLLMPCRIIAKDYGCHPDTVLILLRQYGIPRRKASDYPHVIAIHRKRWKLYHRRVNTSGKNNPSYGRKCTPETREKIRIARARQASPSMEQLQRRSKTWRKTWNKLSRAKKDIWIKKRILACDRKPNKTELYLSNLLNTAYPNEWKYVGDGSVVLNGRNPDFINTNGKKQIIELFGTYWHGRTATGNSSGKEMRLREEAYAQYGYNTLVIWENELKEPVEVIAKVARFSDTGEFWKQLKPMRNIRRVNTNHGHI